MVNLPVMRFDRFELQLNERRLLRDGEVVPLRARAFDLLVVLAERAGRLVTKDELLDLVWPGLVVEENNIAAQVASLRKVLASELIVTVPGRGYRFAALPQATIAAGVPLAAASVVSAAALVTPPRLFGRDADLARLNAALHTPGCVTLVGPSGVGKTSLALAVAMSPAWSANAAAGRAGSLWLDLASLSGGEQLLPELCRALGIDLADVDEESASAGLLASVLGGALGGALGDAPRLLVLDNAEHLIDAVARLVPLLFAAAPALHVLVTSQLPLAITGEQVERIDPLALPDANATDAQALQTGAMEMFVDRVLAADRRFRFTPESLVTVRALCADLDGLPLALEMAAARVPLLGLQRVRDALSERFAMLRHGQRDKPGRHRTLLAALDWSHDLLAPDEQRLFHALGVFAGGFTLDLAVAVAAEEGADAWDTIDGIAALVDRSLVFGNHADPPRYALLETMRSYALTHLAASGQEPAVRARQAAALQALLRQANEAPRDAAGNVLRRGAVDEMHNVREAFEASKRHDAAMATTLAIEAAGLATFTPWRREAVDWLAACEPLLGHLTPALQASWWRHFATQMLFRGSPRAVAAAQQAVQSCRAVGDSEGLMWSLVALGRSTLVMAVNDDADIGVVTDELTALTLAHPEWPARAQAAALGTLALASEARGDYAASLRQRFEELAVAKAGSLDGSIDAAEGNIAEMLARLGRYDEALDRLRAHMARVQGKDSFNIAHLHLGVVDTLLRAGRGAEALAEAEAALRVCRRHGMPEMSDIAALIAAQTGRPHSAALLLGHARRAFAALGGQLVESGASAYNRALVLVRQQLAAVDIERLIAQGEGLDERAADRVLFDGADHPG